MQHQCMELNGGLITWDLEWFWTEHIRHCAAPVTATCSYWRGLVGRLRGHTFDSVCFVMWTSPRRGGPTLESLPAWLNILMPKTRSYHSTTRITYLQSCLSTLMRLLFLAVLPLCNCRWRLHYIHFQSLVNRIKTSQQVATFTAVSNYLGWMYKL